MLRGLKMLSIAAVMTIVGCTTSTKKGDDWLKNAVEVSGKHLKNASKEYYDSKKLPRTINKDGKVHLVPARDWTSGFFPGSLWYMYKLSGDSEFSKNATYYTELLESVQNNTHTHDVGFIMNCSYGHGLDMMKKEKYGDILTQTAKSLISRYNDNIGCIRSWDFGKWEYPVIVDNMMNLELLYRVSKLTNDKVYADIANKHAKTTMKNHFRKDYSSYHVLSYSKENGEVLSKGTYQGYADNSSWARGQAWGVYGYTVCFRETKNKEFLGQAQHIADFIMNLPTMPKDKVPFWDYNAPDVPNAYRDASAAAIVASALIELSQYVENGDKYFNYAEDILKSLSSDKYLATPGENHHFILKHSVGAKPNNKEVDVPLNYADYYYLEALSRYIDLKKTV